MSAIFDGGAGDGGGEGSREVRRVVRTSLAIHIGSPLLLCALLVWFPYRYFSCEDNIGGEWLCGNAFLVPALLFLAMMIIAILQGMAVHRHGRNTQMRQASERKAGASDSLPGSHKKRLPIHEGYLALVSAHRRKVRRSLVWVIAVTAFIVANVIFRYDERPELLNAIVLIGGGVLAIASYYFLLKIEAK